MCSPRQMRERFENLKESVIEIAGECMLEEKEQIVGLLENQQFNESVDSKGNPLREYSKRYAYEKQQQTGRGDKTDLNLTGEFQATLNLTITGDTYSIDSPAITDTGQLKSDWLNKWQKKKGGASVMNLTPDNQDQIFPIIRDAFIYKCNERLALD